MPTAVVMSNVRRSFIKSSSAANVHDLNTRMVARTTVIEMNEVYFERKCNNRDSTAEGQVIECAENMEHERLLEGQKVGGSR